MNANNNELCYDAFISYRHSELDKFVAEELHKQLETYKIPKKIAKKSGKKRINRIFRDRDELPISSNLADPILNALKVSEYLIVICSPRLNESLWCKREIENFIAMHGQEKVLAVLIEGEPSESFPKELLYRQKEVTLENGEVVTIKEPVEPLAADVRGKTKKEVKQHIKNEVLRLLAPMLNCNYDDLKQRHKERKMQRMLAIAAGVCTVGVAFGTVSTIMALEIKEQKEQIDKQYWEALKTNAKMGADNALELLESGDRIAAIAMARELLPDSLENQEIPYTREAFYALTQSIHPYATGANLRPVYQIKANAEISDTFLSRDGNKIGVLTKYGQLTVWDIPEKMKCLDVNINTISGTLTNANDVVFVGPDKIALLCFGKVLLWDINDNLDGNISAEINWDSKYRYRKDIISSKDGKYIAVTFDNGGCILDTESGKTVSSWEISEDREVLLGKSFFYDSDNFVFCDENTEEGADELCIHRVNVSTGEISNTYKVPYGRIADINGYNGYLFVAVNGANEDFVSLTDKPDDALLYCFDVNSGEKIWEYKAVEEYINSIVIPYDNYDCFLFESYGQITALNAKSGEGIGRFTFGGTIVKIFPLQNPDSYIVYTRDGRYVNLVPEQNYNVEVTGRFIAATDNIRDLEWGTDFVAALPYSSKEIIVYDWYEDCDGKELFTLNDSISKLAVSSDGKYLAAELFNKELVVLDNETLEVLGKTEIEFYGDSLSFIGDDKLQKICSNDVYVYDLQCNLLETKELEGENYLLVEGVTLNGRYAYGDDFENLIMLNCATNEIEGKIAKTDCNYTNGDKYSFSNEGDMGVVISKEKGKCSLYNVKEQKEIACVDINATYVETVQFSEDDTYVYIVYEDGLVQRYLSSNLTLNCEVAGLDCITQVIYKKTINGGTKYFFECSEGTYVLAEGEGNLKAEQFIPNMVGVNVPQNKYLIDSSKRLVAFPIYTYQEILGKADKICYDNSLWNNKLVKEVSLP